MSMLNPPVVKTEASQKKRKKYTPDYFHVLDDKRLRDNVYEPEADSFLFLDALDADTDFLKIRFGGGGGAQAASELNVLEVGPGSGVALTHLCAHVLPSALFGSHCDDENDDAEAAAAAAAAGSSSIEGSSSLSLTAFGVDLNPIALEATQQTWDRTFTAVQKSSGTRKPGEVVLPAAYLERRRLNLLTGDLFSPFFPSGSPEGSKESTNVSFAGRKFDVVLFNPPYVPTTQAELDVSSTGGENGHDWLPAAWSGGPDGRVVVDRFLEQLEDRLTVPHGVAYVVALEENMIETMQDQTLVRNHTAAGDESAKRPALVVEIVAMRYTGEKLRVVRFSRERQ